MSFGSLSAQAKEALGRGASEVGTSITTGDGGMTPEERGQSKYLVYQYLPSRYGMNPDDLRKADAIEVVMGQGAKPGGNGPRSIGRNRLDTGHLIGEPPGRRNYSNESGNWVRSVRSYGESVNRAGA